MYHGCMRHPCGVWMAVALAATAPACGFHPSGEGGDDDTTVDADDGDAAATDGSELDGAEADAAAIDARVIDARIIDARMVDAAVDAAIDAAIDARPMCPTSYDVQSQGGNYRFVVIGLVWSSAAADCNDDLPGRTHLATFANSTEMNAVITAVDPGNSAEPLLGFSCAANDCSSTGAWSWVSGGGAVDATMWLAGQPDNGTSEKAGAAIRDMGVWKLQNVTTSLTTRPYICECDP
jgi:hypothetical protein